WAGLKAAENRCLKRGLYSSILAPFSRIDFRRFEPAQRSTFESLRVYKVEGFASDYDGEKRLFLMSTFLPARPTILNLSDREILHWPQASIFSKPANQSFDLVWVERNEMQALQLPPDTRLIYTTTDEKCFAQFKAHLEYFGFQLLTHWYVEGERGHALFLQKHYYDAAMRTLSYTPKEGAGPPPLGPPFHFEPLLKKPGKKPKGHTIDGIDFIYMINLDERPEKFERSARELQIYGINPYRFSAVNGWTLPTKVFDQIGMKLPKGSLQEPLLGSFYYEEEGKEYIQTELIEEEGPAYFIRYLARGSIGIVLSHLSILQDAYDSGYETIWVMEDDIEVCSDPRILPKLIALLDDLSPRWDIFFTDIDTKDAQGKRVLCRALAARPNVLIPPLSSFYARFYPIGDHFHRTGMRYGAYSMILRRSGIKKILDYYRKYRVFLPYDMDFWLCPNLYMVHYNQDIVSHKPGAPSDNHEPRYN
ncbi:MAG TPA: glycosyltransferase family 25 protein, partial [Chlamydiales bacterium]|nr:glycosyltransferase family 25 protein [Chlamydiales bacterium]